MKNFRKVGFGLGPNDETPNDPLQWALTNLMKFEVTWTGKFILRKNKENIMRLGL